MPIGSKQEDRKRDCPADVIAAASSALLLAFSHVHPELWFLSFGALVPFLLRLRQVGAKKALALGLMLATTYMLTTSLGEVACATRLFILKMLSLNVAFAVFGLTINRASRHLGFNPLIIALLWLPIDFFLIRYTHLQIVCISSGASPGLMAGLCSLLGTLLGSVAIILGNSLLLWFVCLLWTHILDRPGPVRSREREYYRPPSEIISGEFGYHFPQPRPPPQSHSLATA